MLQANASLPEQAAEGTARVPQPLLEALEGLPAALAGIEAQLRLRGRRQLDHHVARPPHAGTRILLCRWLWDLHIHCHVHLLRA